MIGWAVSMGMNRGSAGVFDGGEIQVSQGTTYPLPVDYRSVGASWRDGVANPVDLEPSIDGVEVELVRRCLRNHANNPVNPTCIG